MLGEVPGKPDKFMGQFHCLAQAQIGDFKPSRLDPLLVDTPAGRSPDLASKRGDGIFGKPHRFTHFANGGARAKMEHGARR